MKFSKESLRDLIVEEIGAFLNEATPKLSREEEEALRASAKKGLQKLTKGISAGEERYKLIAKELASRFDLRKLLGQSPELIYNAIVSNKDFKKDLEDSRERIKKSYVENPDQRYPEESLIAYHRNRIIEMYVKVYVVDVIEALQQTLLELGDEIIEEILDDFRELGTGVAGEEVAALGDEVAQTAAALKPMASGETQWLSPRE